MRRGVKYKRISRDREGRELGIKRQDEDLDVLGQKRGITYVDDYFDNDLSASTKATKPRPRYEQMLMDARAGKFDVIVAYTQGRLTRRPREFEDLIDLATLHGIEFEYVRTPPYDLNTAQGREAARNRAARDAAEAEELAERVEREKKQAAESGQWRGGPRPYGYGPVVGVKMVWDKKTEQMVERPVYDVYQLVEEEADEIRHATREILQGASLRGLAADLNERGKTTSTGKRWTATELRKVLRRGRNAGLVEVTETDDEGRKVLKELDGVTAKWPAIVTVPEWRALCKVLDDPTRRTNKTNSAKRWLGSGLYRCSVCGDTVRATRVRAHPDYRCAKRNPGFEDDVHVMRRAAYVDEIVEAAVLGWLARPSVARKLRKRQDVDLAALQAEEADIMRQLDEIDDMYSRRETDRAGRLRMRNPELAKLEAVKARIAAAVNTNPLAELVSADDLHAAWKKLSIPKRQAAVDVVCTVTLHPGKKGRPAGWKPGDRYFDPTTVQIAWR